MHFVVAGILVIMVLATLGYVVQGMREDWRRGDWDLLTVGIVLCGLGALALIAAVNVALSR